ncbi:MAG TPA: helix-turn-helix domain-containing protein [Stellaceae bacterium]|nr:helix-turn-helix domain-containing protein [Stellaceae bacterium]
MSRIRGKTRPLAPAERGRIVQRVLVEGWSVAEAAATFGIPERRVANWVAAYRRHGMASLRDEGAVDRAPRRWLWLLRITGARFAARLRVSGDGNPARAIRLLRREETAHDDRDRRSRST